MTERRYDDKETAEIFRAAAEGVRSTPQSVQGSEGFTLAELKEIGQEAGLSPDAITQAVVALDIRDTASQRTLFGLPVGVARTVALNRTMGDAEWERFVVQLREVFRARGRTRADGALREWSNGNLHVMLEPTGSGHQVRFSTVNGGARTSIGTGLATLGVTAAMTISTAMSGTLAHAAAGVALMGLVGVGMIASGALRLPGWARRRSEQMNALAAQVALPPESHNAASLSSS